MRIGQMIVIVLALALGSRAHSQVSPEAAGVSPVSAEIKPWPQYECTGNGFNNLDMIASLIFGHDGTSPCGPIAAGISPDGNFLNPFSGLTIDGGELGQGGLGGPVDQAIQSQPPGSGGFITGISGSAGSGGIVFSYTMKNMDLLNTLLSPETISAASYVGGGESHVFLLFGNAVDSATNAQTIPSGTIENHVDRVPGTGKSRDCGSAALDQDRFVVVTEDMTGGDPGSVFGIPSPGKSVIVITVYRNGPFYPRVHVPSFMYPGLGGDAPARQSVVAYNTGFFIRTAADTAALFLSDGTPFIDTGDYLAAPPLPPGIVSLERGGAERGIAIDSSTGITISKAFIAARGLDAFGKYHPCVVVLELTIPQQTTLVRQVLQVDDDLVDPPDFTDGSAMDVAWGSGLFVAWRPSPSHPPVARFYELDSNPVHYQEDVGPELLPKTPTFWVSTLEDADVNTGDTTIKCSFGEKPAVMWLSQSFNPGLNCVGNQITQDTVIRFFENAVPADVPDWEGY